MTKSLFKKLLKRKPNDHKGDNGHVLIIAGSKNLAGAALLSSVAALRTASDLVTLCCPESVGKSMNSYCPDIMTIKLKGDYLKLSHYSTIIKQIKKYDAILIGNGLGTNKETVKLVRKIILNHPNILKVLDADALKMVSLGEVYSSILTPHKKEFQTLLANSGMKTLQKNKLRNNILLVKGKEDLIITKKETMKNKTGNPGMTKAGTGDILAGICVGLLAKTKDLKNSAVAGAWFSGKLGDYSKKKKEYFYIASDLLHSIKEVKKLIN